MEKVVFNASKKDKLLNVLTAQGFSYAYASKLLRNKDIRVNDLKVKDNILVDEEDLCNFIFNPKFQFMVIITKKI